MAYLIVLIVLILDQITKLWAINSLKPIESIAVIPKIFHLTYVENSGAAFGILQNQKLFFIFATTLIVVGIIIFISKNKKLFLTMKLGLSLIMAGAIGNLIDRIRFSYVVDFFDFKIWPVFNIADISIVIGALLVSYLIIRYDSFSPKEL
ncbi:signal peptidase II [Alkaliphilus serpentinus]|uniref:Lipoprotein signal peptidase n=1 Tax=Alkaliphilus serpentinus TaxID=1482731 RepID=A0A833HRC9_9FIRM|nr:signal peptidase II [Alkaliphilus serpentinus]KAB3533152.1 signal peptidase II [Alkaliphilus serpentinus]